MSESCAAICERMEDAQCGVDLTRCEALCTQQYAMTGANCRTIADQLLECASRATFSCSADGPVATFCAQLETALDGCTRGVPPGEMDVPMQPDPGGPGAEDGGVPASSDDASAPVENPGSGDDDAGGPLADAGGGGELLSCQPSPDDEPCDSCLKSQCCEQVSACGDDCVALIECASTPV